MSSIVRVVIDTNHIISAILTARGASAKLLDWMTREDDYFQLLLSTPIWDEYTTVADWLIPQTKQQEKERILAVLRTWVKSDLHLHVCSDPVDLISIDADKSNNPTYLDLSLKLSKVGTIIIGDNVVREGEVANEQSRDSQVIGVRQFCDALAKNIALTSTGIQTVGCKGYDGFTITIVEHVQA